MRVIILAILLSSLAFGDLEQKGESRVHVSEGCWESPGHASGSANLPGQCLHRCDGAEVALKVVIKKSGTLKQVTVVRAGDSRLAGAALEAARQWRYAQYMLNGSPVEYGTSTTIKSWMCAK